MAMNQVEQRLQDLNIAAQNLVSAIENCETPEERGTLIVGLNRITRQIQNMGVPGARNCSPLIGAQIGDYKICTFMGSKFYREALGFNHAEIYKFSKEGSSRAVFLRRMIEPNESKPTSTSQYVYILRCASDATLGVFQSAFSICKKLLIITKRQKPQHYSRRLGATSCIQYAELVLENLVELGAAEKDDRGLYRLI